MIRLNDIFSARQAINPFVNRTPLVPAYSLGNDRREVRLKLETTQPIGAFKLRGAVNAMSRLTPEERKRGAVCASTGNHGRALAYAARQLGSSATICMSSLVPENKVQAIRRLGTTCSPSRKTQSSQWSIPDMLGKRVDRTVGIPPIPLFPARVSAVWQSECGSQRRNCPGSQDQ